MSDIVSDWMPYHCSGGDCQQAGCPGHEVRMVMKDPALYRFEVSGKPGGLLTLDRGVWEGMVKAHASAWEKAWSTPPAEEVAVRVKAAGEKVVAVEAAAGAKSEEPTPMAEGTPQPMEATFDTPELRAQAEEYAAGPRNGSLKLLGLNPIAAPPPPAPEDFRAALCAAFGVPESVLFEPTDAPADKNAEMEAYYKHVNEPLEAYYKQLEDLILQGFRREEGALHLPHAARKEEEPRVVQKSDEITPAQQYALDEREAQKIPLTEEEVQKSLAKIDSLGLCGCGTDGAWTVLWWLLEMAEDHVKYGSFYGATKGDLLAVDPGAAAARKEGGARPGPAAEDWVQFGAKVIDAWGLTEHGSGIGWAWPEADGLLLLRFFRQHGCDPDAWPERWWFRHECPLCQAEAAKARRANAPHTEGDGFLSNEPTEECSRHKGAVCVSRRATEEESGGL